MSRAISSLFITPCDSLKGALGGLEKATREASGAKRRADPQAIVMVDFWGDSMVDRAGRLGTGVHAVRILTIICSVLGAGSQIAQ
jgi:hypothetical protein